VTAVIIPAHNEETTIGSVLDAVIGAGISEVIVVADACGDDTAQIARAAGAEVVETAAGDKGSAMATGLAHVRDALTLFLDADLSGLQSAHVAGLASLEPLGGMVVGVLAEGPMTSLPPISGERRLPTEFLRRLDLRGSGYRVETLTNAAVGNAGLPWRRVALRGVTNPTRAFSDPASWLSMWVELGATGALNARGLLRYRKLGVST
jgi:glycosyltransferase involved in cell wall biosynthesis